MEPMLRIEPPPGTDSFAVGCWARLLAMGAVSDALARGDGVAAKMSRRHKKDDGANELLHESLLSFGILPTLERRVGQRHWLARNPGELKEWLREMARKDVAAGLHYPADAIPGFTIIEDRVPA